MIASPPKPIRGRGAGFKGQSMLLARMFGLVDGGAIHGPLFDPGSQPGGMDNATYVRQHCFNMLKQAFPHVAP